MGKHRGGKALGVKTEPTPSWEEITEEPEWESAEVVWWGKFPKRVEVPPRWVVGETPPVDEFKTPLVGWGDPLEGRLKTPLVGRGTGATTGNYLAMRAGSKTRWLEGTP